MMMVLGWRGIKKERKKARVSHRRKFIRNTLTDQIDNFIWKIKQIRVFQQRLVLHLEWHRVPSSNSIL